jgi:hypothetical protein
LLDAQPGTNLLELDERARETVTELFVVADVYRRIALDLGKKIQEKAPSPKAGLNRLRQIKDYVRETIGAELRKIKAAGLTSAGASVSTITRQALESTFRVFGGFAT